MTSWAKAIANAAQNAATPHQKPPEAAQMAIQTNPPPPPENAPQRRTEALTASARAALIDAIDAGRTARALDLALQALADLTGDREPMDRNTQDRAAMGEEWRRAYKVWATHAPRIRAAISRSEIMDAYSAAIDACPAITDGTGADGLKLGGGVLEMFDTLLREQLPPDGIYPIGADDDEKCPSKNKTAPDAL